MVDMITVITGSIYPFIISLFTNVLQTIEENPLFFFPVIIGFFGAAVMFVVGLTRRFGVKGVGGRRRRRRR